MSLPVSYAQRGEDLRLAACFGERGEGFYLDVGANHPVYDNVSFAFYQRGWCGILIEPHPEMAALCRAVRPRDAIVEALAGAEPGETPFHLVSEFHGFSTALSGLADSAQRDFGKGHATIGRPLVTLAHLCERLAPPAIDFLSIDVEGYEAQVLAGADFKRFRPKIVLIEALAPYTLAPAWEEWEPLLTRQSYRYACFDSLNRYYVAEEAIAFLQILEDFTEPAKRVRFRDYGRPIDDADHPEAGLARRLAREAMTRLPLLDHALMFDLITAKLPAGELNRAATRNDAEAAWSSVFERSPSPAEVERMCAEPRPTLREVYLRIVDSDAFRAACGRISASSAW